MPPRVPREPEDRHEEAKARRPRLWAYVLGGLVLLLVPVVGLPAAVTLIATECSSGVRPSEGPLPETPKFKTRGQAAPFLG
jgi:hypothetical protein